MNFLKIALSNKLKNNDFNSWQTTNLNSNPQASELAAIVLAEGDQNSLKAAQDLQKTSGLGIPIIKVSHETILLTDFRFIKYFSVSNVSF